MKILIVFILFNLILKIKCVDPPRCFVGNEIYSKNLDIEPMGDYVEWWVHQHFQKGGAFYTDSNLKTKSEKILELDWFNQRGESIESPISKTFEQASEAEFSSIAYNDGYIGTVDSVKGGAHEKGFFIWNENGGIHVIHSIPKTPHKNKKFFINEVDNYMQHSICITIKPSELDIIPKFLIYINPQISLINTEMLTKPTALNKITKDLLQNKVASLDFTELKNDIGPIKTFSAMDKVIEDNFIDNLILPKTIKILQWAKIADHIAGVDFTSEIGIDNMHYYKPKTNWFGDYFVQTSYAKLNTEVAADKTNYLDKMKNVDILWQYIGRYYDSLVGGKPISNWMSQTMTKALGFPETNRYGQYSITLKLNYQFLKDDKERSASRDHSKMMYGMTNDQTEKIMCLGGLNYQNVQNSRGGGAFCSKHLDYLVDYLKRHVSWIRKGFSKVPSSGEYAKIGIPHSTVGTLVDLSWMQTTFTANGISDSMSFEISVPNSPFKLVKRLIEPSTSNYQSENIQLLIDKLTTTPVTYKTEPFSIDVFPSIKDKVHLCTQSGCDFKSSIKLNVASNFKLAVTVSYLSLGTDKIKNIMNVENNPITNPNLVITLPLKTKSYYFSSRIANKAIEGYGSNKQIEKIELIETTENEVNYIKGFLENPARESVCNKVINTNEKLLSLSFLPKCIDLLAFCLHRALGMDIEDDINDDPTLNRMNQNEAFNKFKTILEKLDASLPTGYDICIVPPPDDDPSTITDTNNHLISNSMNDLIEQ
ncbi:hypothetical protein ACTA71_000239 [Dictyostelium dimigraforme]